MLNDKELSARQTFRRLWPMISPFKTGLMVSIGCGGHIDLLAKNGVYAQRHRMQFGE